MTPNEADEMLDLAYKSWPQRSVFRYFARRPHDGAIYGEGLRTTEELVRVTEWADEYGYNSYWMPNPTATAGSIRCKAKDISHWRWLLVDIDPVTPGHYDAALAATRAHSVLAEAFPDKPVLTHLPLHVNSGRGAQLLCPISPPLDLNETIITTNGEISARVAAPQVASYWLNYVRKHLGPGGVYAGCTIDTSCSDLPRVMRMPYTINTKTGARGTIVSKPSGGMFTFEMLAAAVTLVIPSAPALGTSTLARWTDYLPYMTVAGRRFILEGQEEPGRHRMAAAAMLSMLDFNATKEQIIAALLHGSGNCSPKLEPKEVYAMVERRFRNA
jgi:hypothetical protein